MSENRRVTGECIILTTPKGRVYTYCKKAGNSECLLVKGGSCESCSFLMDAWRALNVYELDPYVQRAVSKRGEIVSVLKSRLPNQYTSDMKSFMSSEIKVKLREKGAKLDARRERELVSGVRKVLEMVTGIEVRESMPIEDVCILLDKLDNIFS